MITNNKLFYDSMVEKHYNFVSSRGKEVYQSVVKYTGTVVNKRINRAIREKKPLSVYDRKIVDDLDNLYSDVEPTTQPLILFRGIQDRAHVNADSSFISASYNINISKRFTNIPQKCCLLIFNIPIGSKVLFIGKCSRYPHEDEVLLDRKANFLVTSIKEDDKMGYLKSFFNYLVRNRLKDITQIYISYIPKDSLPVPANIQDIIELGKLSPTKLPLSQLKLKAKMLGCKGYSNMKKPQLLEFIKTCKKSPVKSPVKSPLKSPVKSPLKSPLKSLSPSKLNLVQLKLKAKKLGCKGYSNMKKSELVKFVKICKKSPVKLVK